MEARATVKYVRISPQKARLVIDLIRGKKAADALNILGYSKAEHKGIKRLGFTKKRAAYDIAKALFSAIANAEQKSDTVDVDDLVVKQAYVNDGPRDEEDSARSHGPRLPLSAADEPYYGGGGTARRVKGRARARQPTGTGGDEGGTLWVRRFIRTDFAWDTTRPGSRAGSRKRIMPAILHEDLELKKQLERAAEKRRRGLD